MTYFVTYVGDDGSDHCVRFYVEDGLWEWLQEWRSKKGGVAHESLHLQGVLCPRCVLSGGHGGI